MLSCYSHLRHKLVELQIQLALEADVVHGLQSQSETPRLAFNVEHFSRQRRPLLPRVALSFISFLRRRARLLGRRLRVLLVVRHLLWLRWRQLLWGFEPRRVGVLAHFLWEGEEETRLIDTLHFFISSYSKRLHLPSVNRHSLSPPTACRQLIFQASPGAPTAPPSWNLWEEER